MSCWRKQGCWAARWGPSGWFQDPVLPSPTPAQGNQAPTCSASWTRRPAGGGARELELPSEHPPCHRARLMGPGTLS